MAGFNPFAPQAQQQQQPQMQGFQVPNVAMQDKPGLMETIAPTVVQQAMSSDMAGKAANSVVDFGKQGAKDAWSSLTGASTVGAAMPTAVAQAATGAQAAGLASSAALTGGALAPGAAQAILGSTATAAPLVAGAAGTTGVAAAAPMALMAGPFAPLVLGGMMVAANSGK
jgi:hypothetical protein